MGDGHDCSCAEPQILETFDNRQVCVECGGTVREEQDDDGDEREHDPGQG